MKNSFEMFVKKLHERSRSWSLIQHSIVSPQLSARRSSNKITALLAEVARHCLALEALVAANSLAYHSAKTSCPIHLVPSLASHVRRGLCRRRPLYCHTPWNHPSCSNHSKPEQHTFGRSMRLEPNGILRLRHDGDCDAAVRLPRLTSWPTSSRLRTFPSKTFSKRNSSQLLL